MKTALDAFDLRNRHRQMSRARPAYADGTQAVVAMPGETPSPSISSSDRHMTRWPGSFAGDKFHQVDGLSAQVSVALRQRARPGRQAVGRAEPFRRGLPSLSACYLSAMQRSAQFDMDSRAAARSAVSPDPFRPLRRQTPAVP